MKTKLVSLLILTASLVCLAATSPVVTNTLQRIQTDPNSANGTATAFYEQKTVIGDQTFVAPWVPVTWSLTSDKTVTVGGQTLTYAQVSAFVTAIAEQEYAAAQAK
jgi:hypothetical protein